MTSTGLGVGIGDYRRLHLRRSHSQGDTQVVVYARIDVDRDRAANYQCVYRASVHVPGEDYLVPCLADGHHHRLHRAGRAIHNKYRVLRAESVRRVFLRFLDYGNRVAEVVEGFHGVHVILHADLAEEIPQHLVAASALVPGNVKLYNAVLLIFLHRLVQGGTGMIKPHYAHLFNRCSFR